MSAELLEEQEAEKVKILEEHNTKLQTLRDILESDLQSKENEIRWVNFHFKYIKGEVGSRVRVAFRDRFEKSCTQCYASYGTFYTIGRSFHLIVN